MPLVVSRIAVILLASLAVSGCVDAPITADQLEADGQLRGQHGSQAAFASVNDAAVQQAVQVSAVLAAQSAGPLEDRNVFASDVGEVHLHVRADGLLGRRDVVYRWAHGDFSVLVPGTLTPADSMALGASYAIAPEQYGHWTVEVLSLPESPNPAASDVSDSGAEAAEAAQPARVLFRREFEVLRPVP